MATHSSVLAWGIPGTGEAGGLSSGVTQSWTRLKLLSSSRYVIVFLLVMYECESWTIKKAEHRRIDAFELWC